MSVMSAILMTLCMLLLMNTNTAMSCDYDFQCGDRQRCWDSSCIELPFALGDYCVSSIDCVSSVNEWSDCVENECRCAEGMYESEGSCWKSKLSTSLVVLQAVVMALAITFIPVILLAIVFVFVIQRLEASVVEPGGKKKKSVPLGRVV